MTVGQVLSDPFCQRVRDAWRPSFHPSYDRTWCPGHWRHQDHVSPSCSCCSTACSRRIIGSSSSRRAHCLNPPRSMVSAPLALIHANDLVLVPSGPNPLVMHVRHLLLPLLGVTVCLQDLFFVAIISVASPSWRDLCGDHHSPASRDRWLSLPSLPCSAYLCLAIRPCSFHAFLIVLAILPAVGYALLHYTLLTENGFSLCC